MRAETQLLSENVCSSSLVEARCTFYALYGPTKALCLSVSDVSWVLFALERCLSPALIVLVPACLPQRSASLVLPCALRSPPSLFCCLGFLESHECSAPRSAHAAGRGSEMRFGGGNRVVVVKYSAARLRVYLIPVVVLVPQSALAFARIAVAESQLVL